jgi:hypothetical protein
MPTADQIASAVWEHALLTGTAGERLRQLAGHSGTAGDLLRTIGAGATAADRLTNYSGLTGVSAAQHLLVDRLLEVRAGVGSSGDVARIDRFNQAVRESSDSNIQSLMIPGDDPRSILTPAQIARLNDTNAEALALILAICEAI